MAFEFLKSVFAPAEKPRAEEQRAKWRDAAAIEAKVKDIVAGALNQAPEHVTLETNSYEEGDSVGNVEILMECEEEFGLEIPDEVAEHLATVGQILTYIQQQLGVAPKAY